MVEEDYIDVKFDIFEYSGQRARVRKTLTVGALIEEILREFDDIPPDPSNKYVLYLKDLEKPLDSDKNLIELDIQTHDQLVFDRHRTFLRRTLPPDVHAYFVENQSAEVYEIQWYPAVIGRLSTDMDHNFSLAVNLQYLPDGKTVSRRHAQVIYSADKFFIEPQAEHNPVYLNGKEMPYMKRFEIKDGDKLMLGFKHITLTFKRKKISPSHQQATETPQEFSKPGKKIQPDQAKPTADFTVIKDKPSVPQLIIEAAGNSDIIGQSINLDSFPFSIGRTLPLLSDERDISRLHAEITFDEDNKTYYIKDLDSTNGVAINHKPIESNKLHEILPGCQIRLGIKVLTRFEA